VDGEPLLVYVCHCDFCQRRSGNVFIASAQFPEEQVVSITGETRCYNGLEVDGIGAVGMPGGINYRFCAVCGSSIYMDAIFPHTGERVFTIALGCFVDPVFPPPTTEFFTKFRHPWVPPIPAPSSSTTRWMVRSPSSLGCRVVHRTRHRVKSDVRPSATRQRAGALDRPCRASYFRETTGILTGWAC
jgi:hypothetical protein